MQDNTAKKRQIISLVTIFIIIAASALIAIFVGKPLLHLLGSPGGFKAWVKDKGLLGELAMIGMMALQIVVAVMPGEPMEVGAGYGFGWFHGMILCMLGAALGTVISFLLTKKFGMKLIEAFIPKEKIEAYAFLHETGKLKAIIFFLYLIPGTPKDFINYLLGLTDIDLFSVVWITTFARIPSIVSSTLTGSLASDERYTAAIIIYGVTFLLSISAMLLYKKKTNKGVLKNEKQNSAG